jgi:BlaI family transcriptional regulator, penicillinase repressor
MPRRKLQQLTERQLEVMDAVWRLGVVTVADVHDQLRHARIARKTVATILSRLEEQGLLLHTTDGREFVYRARVTREQVARAKLRSMLDYVLGGSTPSLIRYALEAEEVAPGDIERVQEMLRKYASESSDDAGR